MTTEKELFDKYKYQLNDSNPIKVAMNISVLEEVIHESTKAERERIINILKQYAREQHEAYENGGTFALDDEGNIIDACIEKITK